MQRGRKRSEGTRGLVVASLGRPGGSRRWPRSRRWPGRVAARAGRVPVLLAGRKTTGEGGGGGLGRLEELGRLGWTGKRQVTSFSLFLLFLFQFCFYYSVNLRLY